MRTILFLAFIFLFSVKADAQTFRLAIGETPQDFIARTAPLGQLTLPILIDTVINGRHVLGSGYQDTLQDPPHGNLITVEVYILIQKGKSQEFTRISLDSFWPEGDQPTINSVFFANVDHDTAPEIFVLVSWLQRHADVSGTLFGTCVYDHLNLDEPKRPKKLEELSKEMDGACDCTWNDGTSKTARFISQASILEYLRTKRN